MYKLKVGQIYKNLDSIEGHGEYYLILEITDEVPKRVKVTIINRSFNNKLIVPFNSIWLIDQCKDDTLLTNKKKIKELKLRLIK